MQPAPDDEAQVPCVQPASPARAPSLRRYQHRACRGLGAPRRASTGYEAKNAAMCPGGGGFVTAAVPAAAHREKGGRKGRIVRAGLARSDEWPRPGRGARAGAKAGLQDRQPERVAVPFCLRAPDVQCTCAPSARACKRASSRYSVHACASPSRLRQPHIRDGGLGGCSSHSAGYVVTWPGAGRFAGVLPACPVSTVLPPPPRTARQVLRNTCLTNDIAPQRHVLRSRLFELLLCRA